MQLVALRRRIESRDCTVIDHSHVEIRLHTIKNDVKKVIVHYTDNYLPPTDAAVLEMKKAGSDQVNDHWTAALTAPYHRIKHTFEVIGNDGGHVIFGDRSIEKFSDEKLREDGLYFKVPYFHDIDCIKTPAWPKDIAWYQIFPERPANGDKSNDPVNAKPWNPGGHPGREDFYSGDLQGALDHLDDL